MGALVVAQQRTTLQEVKDEITTAKNALDITIGAAQAKANSAHTMATNNQALLAKKTEITLTQVEAKVNAAKQALIDNEIKVVADLAKDGSDTANANSLILAAKADLTKVQELVGAKADTAIVNQKFSDVYTAISNLKIPISSVTDLQTKLNNLQTDVDNKADAASVTAGFKSIVDWVEKINPCGAGLQLKDSNDASKGCGPCQTGYVCPALGPKKEHKQCPANQYVKSGDEGTAFKDTACTVCKTCAPGWTQTSNTCDTSDGSYPCKREDCTTKDVWDCKGYHNCGWVGCCWYECDYSCNGWVPEKTCNGWLYKSSQQI